MCLLRANTADQILDSFLPAFPRLGVRLDDIVVVNFAMWMNTCAPPRLIWPLRVAHAHAARSLRTVPGQSTVPA